MKATTKTAFVAVLLLATLSASINIESDNAETQSIQDVSVIDASNGKQYLRVTFAAPAYGNLTFEVIDSEGNIIRQGALAGNTDTLKNTTFTPGSRSPPLEEGSYTLEVISSVFGTISYGFELPAATVHMITFLDWDGTILQSSYVHHGEMPKFSGEVPTRPNEDGKGFEFSGWDKELTPVIEDATYTATYSEHGLLSEDVMLFIHADDTVTIAVVATDGLVVPDGVVTISYAFSYFDDFLGDYSGESATLDDIQLTNGDYSSLCMVSASLAGISEYPDISSVWASYTSSDGTMNENTNTVIYSPEI